MLYVCLNPDKYVVCVLSSFASEDIVQFANDLEIDLIYLKGCQILLSNLVMVTLFY